MQAGNFCFVFIKIICGGFYNILYKTLLFRNTFIMNTILLLFISSAHFLSHDTIGTEPQLYIVWPFQVYQYLYLSEF
jgi:hypothetical protein